MGSLCHAGGEEELQNVQSMFVRFNEESYRKYSNVNLD
jgi:hypothetical protein